MSEYIQPGGGFYGQRLPAKSVYYAAPVAAEQQQQHPQHLAQQFGADMQLPPGAVPVINLPNAPLQPAGLNPLSFNQEVAAGVPQLQQQYQPQQYQQPQALQQPLQRQQQAYGGAPTLVNSDYAAAGWGSQQFVTPIRVINAPQALSSQQQPQAGLVGAAQPNADLLQAQSEYEQAMAMAQRAEERLRQLNAGLTPQVQYSGFGAAPQALTVPGVQLPAAQREPSQVRFGGVQRIPTPTNSSYRFEDAAPGKPAAAPAPRKLYQQQADSVYIGMPNDLYLAGNRPQGYHYAPQQAAAQPQQQRQQEAYRQPSNTNLRTARESASNAILRRMLSDENVRTAILNEGNVIGHAETRYDAAAAGQQQEQMKAAGAGGGLQAGSSDYHFDALRGLNSAY